jgi:hypothetical protein
MPWETNDLLTLPPMGNTAATLILIIAAPPAVRLRGVESLSDVGLACCAGTGWSKTPVARELHLSVVGPLPSSILVVVLAISAFKTNRTAGSGQRGERDQDAEEGGQ